MAVLRATTPGERARARLTLGRARLEQGDTKGAEPLLWEALADGLIDAGDVLAPVLASSQDRSPDIVRLRRQQVMIDPGDVRRLDALRVAALADDDRVYARAIEHALRAFDPGAGRSLHHRLRRRRNNRAFSRFSCARRRMPTVRPWGSYGKGRHRCSSETRRVTGSPVSNG